MGNIVFDFNLFFVGLTSTGIGILGLIIFLNNSRSITNITFLGFSLATIFYSGFNYVQQIITIPVLGFWFWRLIIFFAVWHAFSLFQLFFVFPREAVEFPWWYKKILTPLVVVISVLNLTPLVFQGIKEVSSDGHILKIANGPAIGLFGITIAFLVIGGLYLLYRRTIAAAGTEREQFRLVGAGAFLTFLLIIIFNLLLPAFFDNSEFVYYFPAYLLPFIIFFSYAVIRHHLFNIRIIATEVFTFILAVITLFEAILSREGTIILILRFIVFVMVLIFGVLLIRSARKEVRQKEELERLTKEMQETNAKLTELSSFKSQLLSLASHQIKSPLAVIKGFTDILLEGLYGDMNEKVKAAILKIRHSTDDLIALINTLLDLRRVDEGKMEFQFTRINFLMLVGGLVEQLKPLATAKSLQLNFSGDECMVRADEQKLRQVIQNLVDNSIKYTPSGHIDVSVTNKGSSALFVVEDSGLGISATLLPNLFEEFVRDDRVKKQIRGTGLGLYIARRIVEAHGGKVWAESAGEGKGSRFLVELPLYQEVAAAPPPHAPEAAKK